MSEVEKSIEAINASLKQVGDQLKANAERAEKEIKAHAQLSEETKAKVDQLLVAQGELQARLQAAEQMVAQLESGGSPGRPKSLGELVAESDQIRNFNAGMQGQVTVKLGSIHAAVTSDPASGGDLIVPQRVPGIVTPNQQRLFLRDLLTWGRTGSNSIEYVKESGFTNNANVVSENPVDGKPESDLIFELAAEPVA